MFLFPGTGSEGSLDRIEEKVNGLLEMKDRAAKEDANYHESIDKKMKTVQSELSELQQQTEKLKNGSAIGKNESEEIKLSIERLENSLEKTIKGAKSMNENREKSLNTMIEEKLKAQAQGFNTKIQAMNERLSSDIEKTVHNIINQETSQVQSDITNSISNQNSTINEKIKSIDDKLKDIEFRNNEVIKQIENHIKTLEKKCVENKNKCLESQSSLVELKKDSHEKLNQLNLDTMKVISELRKKLEAQVEKLELNCEEKMGLNEKLVTEKLDEESKLCQQIVESEMKSISYQLSQAESNFTKQLKGQEVALSTKIIETSDAHARTFNQKLDERIENLNSNVNVEISNLESKFGNQLSTKEREIKAELKPDADANWKLLTKKLEQQFIQNDSKVQISDLEFKLKKQEAQVEKQLKENEKALSGRLDKLYASHSKVAELENSINNRLNQHEGKIKIDLIGVIDGRLDCCSRQMDSKFKEIEELCERQTCKQEEQNKASEERLLNRLKAWYYESDEKIHTELKNKLEQQESTFKTKIEDSQEMLRDSVTAIKVQLGSEFQKQLSISTSNLKSHIANANISSKADTMDYIESSYSTNLETLTENLRRHFADSIKELKGQVEDIRNSTDIENVCNSQNQHDFIEKNITKLKEEVKANLLLFDSKITELRENVEDQISRLKTCNEVELRMTRESMASDLRQRADDVLAAAERHQTGCEKELEKIRHLVSLNGNTTFPSAHLHKQLDKNKGNHSSCPLRLTVTHALIYAMPLLYNDTIVFGFQRHK